MEIIKWPIGEALAFHTMGPIFCALGVSNAKARAAVITEVKFDKGAVQMSFATMLIDTA
jgi:hypothetical protein